MIVFYYFFQVLGSVIFVVQEVDIFFFNIFMEYFLIWKYLVKVIEILSEFVVDVEVFVIVEVFLMLEGFLIKCRRIENDEKEVQVGDVGIFNLING